MTESAERIFVVNGLDPETDGYTEYVRADLASKMDPKVRATLIDAARELGLKATISARIVMERDRGRCRFCGARLYRFSHEADCIVTRVRELVMPTEEKTDEQHDTP